MHTKTLGLGKWITHFYTQVGINWESEGQIIWNIRQYMKLKIIVKNMFK